MATRGSTAKSQLNNYLIICVFFFWGPGRLVILVIPVRTSPKLQNPDNSARFCANDRNGRNDKNDKVFGGLKTN